MKRISLKGIVLPLLLLVVGASIAIGAYVTTTGGSLFELRKKAAPVAPNSRLYFKGPSQVRIGEKFSIDLVLDTSNDPQYTISGVDARINVLNERVVVQGEGGGVATIQPAGSVTVRPETNPSSSGTAQEVLDGTKLGGPPHPQPNIFTLTKVTPGTIFDSYPNLGNTGPPIGDPPRCGGFAGRQCPSDFDCVDDPSDSCDPNRGGADCGGICVSRQGVSQHGNAVTISGVKNYAVDEKGRFKGFTGTGVVATLTFTAERPGKATIQLAYTSPTATDDSNITGFLADQPASLQKPQERLTMVPEPISIEVVTGATSTPSPTIANIQSLIDALPSAGGEVLLPAGTYLLEKSSGGVETYPDGSPIQSAIIINKPNVLLRGTGSGTILKLADKVKMRAISVTASNVTIKDLVIDGNKSGRDGSTPWPGGHVVDALLYGSSTAKNITVANVEVKNGIEDGIGFWKSRDVVVENNYTHDNGTMQAGGAGISLSGVVGGRAVNNRVEGNTATGIWSSFDANNITISNNSISKNRSGGITLGGGTVDIGLGSNNSGFSILDNVLSDNGAAGFASITIFASSNGTLKGNRMNTSYFDSIQIDGTGQYLSKNWVITNNTCSNNTSDPGIRNLGHSQNISIHSNNCKGEPTLSPTPPTPTPTVSPTSTPTPTPEPRILINFRLQLEGRKSHATVVDIYGISTIDAKPSKEVLQLLDAGGGPGPSGRIDKLGTTITDASGIGTLSLDRGYVGAGYYLLAQTPSHLRKASQNYQSIRLDVGQNPVCRAEICTQEVKYVDFGMLTAGDVYSDEKGNKDNLVNTFDVGSVFAAWSGADIVGREERPTFLPETPVPADLNGDGVVNNRDLAMLLANFNKRGDTSIPPSDIKVTPTPRPLPVTTSAPQ